jgi:hypothetical protein
VLALTGSIIGSEVMLSPGNIRHNRTVLKASDSSAIKKILRQFSSIYSSLVKI